jgi:hypothetical protein
MSKHAAVYSVVGANGKINFVGVSRNVALSLACHAKNEGPSMVSLTLDQHIVECVCYYCESSSDVLDV